MEENWRNLPDTVREDFQDWVRRGMKLREETGKERYGDHFVGDPLIRAISQAFDILFFLYLEDRKRKEELSGSH